ncbi:MAG: ABC-F family ATP-binding cassette domain-containing protein, partial [Balneolaceae bacterium]
TLTGEVESAFDEIKQLEKGAASARSELEKHESGSEEHNKALKEFGEIQHKLENLGAYSLQSEIERVLKGLGFNDEDFTRPTTEFSGGWLMRIALAKLLLKRPTYLMLDEPTNHLDIESLQWIESFLRSYEGTVIVVSHDRAFLNSITTRTLALQNGRMDDFAGNYSYYEKKYEEQQELIRKKYENQKQEIKETERFIDRFRYKASKAKQVQSRIKQLEKLELVEPDEEQGEITFRFPPPERSGQIVMKLNDVYKSYDEQVVFEGIDFEVERGDKFAVVGPNGAGKSTLIRILAGIETDFSGSRVPGYNVTTTYFAQHQAEELDPENNALDELKRAASGESETRLRTILGCFLFSGDDVFKKVKVLSGGEKSRLALAKMLVTPANFLIFDEPTNHLDMQSKNILQQALQQFEGSLMIVSHDRDFLDPLVNKTLEVQPGALRTFPGNVSWYLSRKEEEQNNGKAEQNGNSKSAAQNQQEETISRKEQKRIDAEKRNERYRKIRPLEKRLKSTENDIEKLENRKLEIEAMMADPAFYEDDNQVKTISIEYEQLKNRLSETYSKWEELAGRIEYLEEEIE